MHFANGSSIGGGGAGAGRGSRRREDEVGFLGETAFGTFKGVGEVWMMIRMTRRSQ